MFPIGYFIWPRLLPLLALLVALAILGTRDILFALDLRSSRRAIRGLALLALPIVAAAVFVLVLAGAVLKLIPQCL